MHRHEGGHDIDWHGEDDGAVVLCRDAVQGLEVAELGKPKLLIHMFCFLVSTMIVFSSAFCIS